VPAHVIDKGMPTSALLAQVLVAKYLDHRKRGLKAALTQAG
jgi:transposase